MKIKKGDKIKVRTGRDAGKTGVVERIYAKGEKVLVPGVNIYKKHIKKNQEMPQGGVVDLPRAIASSKVALICPKCGKTTRVGYVIEKEKKLRKCKKCKKTF